VTPRPVGGLGLTFGVDLPSGFREAYRLGPAFEEHHGTESPTHVVFLPELELVHSQPVNTDRFRLLNDPDTQIRSVGGFVAGGANLLPTILGRPIS
jgi:hypothetical protein